jgi:nitroreductase
MGVGECAPIRKELLLAPEHCEHFLRTRRSIRVYKSDPVSRTDISKLIEIARYAPSGHNCQCVEWLVYDNKEELRGLVGIVADWMRWVIDNMPESDLGRHMAKMLNRWENGKDVILRDAPVVIIAHAEAGNRMAPSSCTLALGYLELAAASMDLGCCWAGYFSAAATSFPSMKEALSLPKGHQCYGAMMVGYPRFSYHRLPTRNPPSITWR